jgi:hypothetical protein
MVAAATGAIYGDDAKLYYSATLGGAGALTEIDCVVDDTVTRERRSSEVVYRGATEVMEHVGKSKNSISATLMLLVGGATYLAMRSAFDAKTVLHYAATTGDITEIGCLVTRMEGQIKSWVESRPDNGNVTVSVEIVKSPKSTYSTVLAVVAS